MSVYATLGGLKGFLKPKSSRTDVSSLVFDLHRLTAVILLACSILSTAKQFFGESIHCSTEGKISVPMFQSFCFMAGTYSVVRRARDSSESVVEAHPGVSLGEGARDRDNVFHSYYQWVCIILVLQAALAYLPYHLWKAAEGGRVRRLLVKVSHELLTETSVANQVSGICSFLTNHRGWFNGCSLKRMFCHILCSVGSLTQLYIMDLLLNGHFLDLGSDLSDLASLQANLALVFPKVVKCYMNHFGPSGSLVPQHGLCTLPVNIVNEKIFLVLWLWFILLTLFSLLHLSYSILSFVLPSFRMARLRTFCPSLHPALFRQLASSLSYGDTVLLMLIAKNCDTAQFTALLSTLATQVGGHYGSSNSIEEPYGDGGSLLKRKVNFNDAGLL